MRKVTSKMRFVKLLSALMMLTVSAACGGGQQTPLHLQEPYVKQAFVKRYAEDRITLYFHPGVSTLSEEQKQYIARFLGYYQGSPDTLYLVSQLIPEDREDLGRLPRHQPEVRRAVLNVVEEVRQNGVRPRLIKEVDTARDRSVIEARAIKSIVDSSQYTEGDRAENLEGLVPNPQALLEGTKVAVVVREYDIQAANCVRTGYMPWRESTSSGTGIAVGCAINQNFLAQLKDKTVLVEGDEMDDNYNSAAEVLAIRGVQRGEFNPDFSTLNRAGLNIE